MKKLFNIFMVLLAFALATTAFVSCKNDSDDDDASVVAEYTLSDTESGEAYTETITFYDDNTAKLYISEGSESETINGNWTGSLSTGGTVTFESHTGTFVVSGNTIIVSFGEEDTATYTKK